MTGASSWLAEQIVHLNRGTLGTAKHHTVSELINVLLSPVMARNADFTRVWVAFDNLDKGHVLFRAQVVILVGCRAHELTSEQQPASSPRRVSSPIRPSTRSGNTPSLNPQP